MMGYPGKSFCKSLHIRIDELPTNRIGLEEGKLILSSFLNALMSSQKGGLLSCASDANGSATKNRILRNRIPAMVLTLFFENEKVQSPFHRSHKKENEGDQRKQKRMLIFIIKPSAADFKTNEKHI